ncbi:MAG: S-layer homology domain-containing protein [Anaerovoracaceae bacterium]|jgi:hypothetical protein
MRKVLSFVLVLALVLGSFSMAFAANTSSGLTDIAGNANEDAIKVAYDLGIVTGNPDGTYLPGKAVNRAEFAALITRALAIPDSALAGYTSTTFKDTVGYGWAVPYLAFCQSKGIMIGDGQGNAMPGRTITVNEAMTMALRAIGYTENSSLLVGKWPANYVTIAQNEDLYDKVAATTTVDKASAAQIIYNLLTVQKVAVNTDGETVFQTIKVNGNTVAANLLNTNLGCEEVDDVILGDASYSYDNSLINITDKIGAFGTAYVNDDDELVAFTVKSTALTGKVDGSKFKVGDTKYDFGTNTFTTDGAVFTNSDYALATDGAITISDISAVAAAASDDEKTVTINVDLSGKKIKDIYSVVAWKATATDLASSDVQDDIEDGELLSEEFALDDNDDIDMNSFQLVGVASLEDIAKDNVVYVYVDNNGAGDIRKVAVGTETVEGIVDELDEDASGDATSVVINDTEYDIAPLATDAAKDLDVDSEGTFYLDVNGEIYDFDGTGTVNSYGVVKVATPATDYDNFKLRLYKSDDSTSTLYFADDTDEIDYVSGATDRSSVVTKGALIGYTLDANGDIEKIDDTVTSAATGDVTFQSTKVLKVGTKSYSIDANAVVFTYSTDAATYTDSYDVVKLSEVETGTITGTTYFILNKDGKVAALFIEEGNVDVDEDYEYGVFNTRRNVKNDDDKAVFKFTGYIDGTAFTKLTDDRAGVYNGIAGVFGLYEITIDANDVITDVDSLHDRPWTDGDSGYVALDKVIASTNTDRTVITDTKGDKWTIDEDAVVYLYDADDEEFTVSKLSALKKDYTVSLYDTKGDDADGIATVVIYFED